MDSYIRPSRRTPPRSLCHDAIEETGDLTENLRALEIFWEKPWRTKKEKPGEPSPYLLTSSSPSPYLMDGMIDSKGSMAILQEEAMAFSLSDGIKRSQQVNTAAAEIGAGAIETRKSPSSYKGVFQELADFVTDMKALKSHWDGDELPPFSLKQLEAPWTYIYAMTYFFLISMSEIFTAYFNPRLGMMLDSALMFALFAHAAFLYPSDKKMSAFLMTIGLAPLIRIISLSAPLSPFSYIQWFLVLSVPLFVGILILRFLLSLREEDLGLVFNPETIHWEFAVALTGIPLGTIEYFILKPGPLIDYISVQTMLTPVLIMMICTGLIEELIFRGLIQSSATKVFGPGFAIIFSACVFGLLHIGNLSLLSVLFATLVGVYFSLVIRRTGSIIGISVAHGITNCTLFLVMPLYF